MNATEIKKQELEQGRLREAAISEIINKAELIASKDSNSKINTHKIEFRGQLKEFPVYQIPLKNLIYNKFNGRILSETKSMESLGQVILAHTTEGKKIIEKLLWNSKLKENKKTKNLLDKLGQEKVAVISKDGVVIDGNRRTMLLNQLPQYDHLETIVLPLSSYDDFLEIENIETQIQMGGDKAIDYDPIQIYLKIQSMYIQMCKRDLGGFHSEGNDELFFKKKFDKDKSYKAAVESIFEKIGQYKTIERVSDIEFFLQVMDTMDEYLHTLGIPEAYPALDGKEEQFRGLTTSLNSYYGEKSKKPFRQYTDDDVDDYKLLSFDFIRMKQKNEDFRMIAGRKERKFHIIGDKDRWYDFFDNHFKIRSRYKEEPFPDIEPSQIKNVLNARDADFKKNLSDDFYKNYDLACGKVKRKRKQDEPDELITEAIDNLEAINPNSETVNDEKVQKKVEKLTSISLTKLGAKAQLFLIEKLSNWLDKVLAEDKDTIDKFKSEDKEEIVRALLSVQKKSFDASKILKKQ